jgi:hypothetical protein
VSHSAHVRKVAARKAATKRKVANVTPKRAERIAKAEARRKAEDRAMRDAIRHDEWLA